MVSKKNSALLKGQINNQALEQQLPFVEGSVGPRAVDIRSLYQKSGIFTYDPGYTSTASCSSKITYIDGDKGILMHRGYLIEDLTDRCDFLEVCHLLLKGELPTLNEKQKFDRTITEHTMLHDQVQYFFRGFRRDAHPMAVMVGVVGALSAFYHDSLDINNPHHRWVSSIRLLAKMPTIAAWAYKYSIGQPFLSPVNSLSFTENFLRMTFGVPAEDYHVAPEVVRVLDQIFILHADHEQNASTSTVRLAGSSGANPFACIAAGISSLWGPAHGGANEAVLSMLSEIGTEDRIGEYLARARDKDDPFRLSGFGHRVYREFDPRAKVLRDSAHAALNALGVTDEPRLRLALKLEKIALEDDYFISRKLFPNVDFYSGIILSAMGFPVTMFTALFALARTVGWVAHWNEMMSEPDKKIGRPRQIYTGEPHREFVAIAHRHTK